LIAVSDQHATNPRNPRGASRDPPPEGDTDASGPRGEAEEVKVLTARTAELEASVEEFEERWHRALADLDNLRKRLAREVQRERADERARVVAEWLPIVDNLELALDHATADPVAVIEGVQAVRDQAVAILERLGFSRIDDAGVPFNPARHEAIATVRESGAAPGTVVRVVRPGYGEGEGQLRPAAVVVATGET
jgi:molecular chaperone GrpE